MHILVVDDDAEIRAYVELALATSGHQVTAADSAAGVEPGSGWGLALVDLIQPGDVDVGGFIERLVAHAVPVVVMTGLASDAPPVQQALTAGAVVVLRKPFTLAALRDCVARWAISERTGPRGSGG